MSLGPDARSLLDAAAGGDDPSADDAARVRAKLGARLAVGVAAGAAATALTKSAAGATAATTAATTTAVSAATTSVLSAKVLVAVVLVGGAAATGAAVIASTPQPASTTLPAPASSAEAAAKPTRPTTMPAGSSPTPIATELAVASAEAPSAEPAPRVPRRVDPIREGTREPAAEAAEPVAITTPTRDSVAEEAALLRAANAALARNDGATALARLDEHAARFPRGALSEEREAARVLALCASGRATEARAAATTFVAASPRSPFVAQVRRACATQP